MPSNLNAPGFMPGFRDAVGHQFDRQDFLQGRLKTLFSPGQFNDLVPPDIILYDHTVFLGPNPDEDNPLAIPFPFANPGVWPPVSLEGDPRIEYINPSDWPAAGQLLIPPITIRFFWEYYPKDTPIAEGASFTEKSTWTLGQVGEALRAEVLAEFPGLPILFENRAITRSDFLGLCSPIDEDESFYGVRCLNFFIVSGALNFSITGEEEDGTVGPPELYFTYGLESDFVSDSELQIGRITESFASFSQYEVRVIPFQDIVAYNRHLTPENPYSTLITGLDDIGIFLEDYVMFDPVQQAAFAASATSDGFNPELAFNVNLSSPVLSVDFLMPYVRNFLAG